MNATLQSLANTEKLSNYFLNKFQYNPNDKTKIMANEFYKLLINLNDRNKKSFPPNDFKKTLSQENPQFQGIQANDSKDLINFLIERLHKELNIKSNQLNNNNYIVNQLNEKDVLLYFLQDFKYNYKSIISDLFYGVLETKSKCCGCQNIKYNFQIYSFLEFPLEQVNNYFFQNGKKYMNFNGTNPDIDLYECFEYYQKIDMMTGENQMYCNICNYSYDSLYSTSLYSAPQYLIINLNRGKNAVYQCKVKFPEQLNLLNFLSFKDGITVLKLYAVICHYGPSSMSGHFIAFCRNNKDDKWYMYNDAIVSPCTKPDQYNDGMPYILFYKAV
jgi:ubiquitin C-terminal hydrolase